MREPRLRTVDKYTPPYPLNRFPSSFPYNLAKEIVFFLATRHEPRLEGEDWEEIFARVIGANWQPSNVGLDDVVLKQCAWGAKTVKANKPSVSKKIRLISGRNSPVYSYGDSEVSGIDPNELGEKILEIWNERVAAVRSKYKHVRTVVLVKSADLLELVVFEHDTVMFDNSLVSWKWNKNNNLVGIAKNGKTLFTWQPHGSQFTIHQSIPNDRLALQIKPPTKLDRDTVLKSIKFDKSWVKVL